MDSTNAARQARWQKRRKEELSALRVRVAELEAENAALRGRGSAPLSQTVEELRQRKAAAQAQRKAGRAARYQETEPAAEEETLDDLRAKLVVKQEQIKGLRTRWQNARIAYQALLDQQARQGKVLLDDAGWRLISSCLHPDNRAPDPKKLEQAFKLFQNLGLQRN